MLEAFGLEHGCVCILASGLSGKEDPALVAAFVDAVHSFNPKADLEIGVESTIR